MALPFENKLYNKIEYFNEGCILMSSNTLILFTDTFDSPQLKNISGYALIGLFLFNTVINTIFILIENGKKFYLIIKKEFNILMAKYEK